MFRKVFSPRTYNDVSKAVLENSFASFFLLLTSYPKLFPGRHPPTHPPFFLPTNQPRWVCLLVPSWKGNASVGTGNVCPDCHQGLGTLESRRRERKGEEKIPMYSRTLVIFPRHLLKIYTIYTKTPLKTLFDSVPIRVLAALRHVLRPP